MSSTGVERRPLTRSVWAAARAAGDAGGALYKHRCTIDHASSVLDRAFPHAQSPISWLSNEELLMVFEQAFHIVFTDPATYMPPWKPALMVTISHVCRRWRAIALSHSYLWTYILPSSLSEVERHLSYSATRPLMISGMFLTPQVATGSPYADGGSTTIANALVQSAHRWQVLHWLDRTANGTVNVLRLMRTPKAYPMLEYLVIMLRECLPLGNVDPARANAAVLFPALKHLRLIRVHPMFLPHSPMPALQYLKLECLNERFLFSQLFSLLYRSPALCTLELDFTVPTIGLLGSFSDPTPRLFPNAPLRGARFTLPRLTFLSLHPAPAAGLQHLFGLLHLPALQRLDLHLYASPHTAHWPLMTADGRAARIPFSQSDRLDGPVVRLAALRNLCVTYCIPAALAPNVLPELPKLRNIAFPALIELGIAHSFVPCPPAPGTAQVANVPLPQPLRPFDALFHTPSFTHVRLLMLSGCALPLGMLCDALRTRFPALEVLELCACPGAGPLVCALAPGACEGGCERPGLGDVWVGAKLREVGVRRCDDVHVGCLRKVIETRLSARRAAADPGSSGGAAAANPELETSADPAASTPEVLATSSPAPSIWHATGSSLAGEVVLQRLAMVRVFECAGVTREDACALAAIPRALAVVWKESGGKYELFDPEGTVPHDNGSA